MKCLIPTMKIGTPYQSPAWRYEAMKNPLRFGLVEQFCSVPKGKSYTGEAGFLRRRLEKGVVVSCVFMIPDYFRSLSLPTHLYNTLMQVWSRNWKKTHKKKMTVPATLVEKIGKSWNLKKIEELPDAFLRKAIRHIHGDLYDEAIEFALVLHEKEEYAHTLRYLGFSFYAGLSDVTIAKRWKITVDKVEALRCLFFDFSHFPTDKVGAWALLRQFAEGAVIKETDFYVYKKIHDLGELGMKMVENYHHLTEREKDTCKNFLGETAIENAIHLNLCIRTSKDAWNYTNVVSNFAKYSLLKEELRQKEAALRLTELQITRMSKENSKSEATGILREDEDLLKAMKEISKIDSTPRFTTFSSLFPTAVADKLTVEQIVQS